MRIWIDNTGLQSAESCVDGRASSEEDVRGLLQLATYLVYAKHISINGFEDQTIREYTERAVDRLYGFGLPHKDCVIEQVDRDTYARACRAAAFQAHPSFRDAQSYKGGHFASVLAPKKLPRGEYEQQLAFIELARADESRLLNVREEALDRQAVGAVDYMVAVSRTLRKKLATLELTPQEAYRLSIYLRFRLNEALARIFDATYGPSVSRASLIDDHYTMLIKVLESETTQIADDFRQRFKKDALGVPATSAYLLKRSKGEPEAVLIEAIALRERTKALRDHLNSISQLIRKDDGETLFDATCAVHRLSDQVREIMGSNKQTGLIDGISLRAILGDDGAPPSVTPSAALNNIKNWFQERANRRRTVALTSVVKSAVMLDDEQGFYNQLTQRSRRRM